MKPVLLVFLLMFFPLVLLAQAKESCPCCSDNHQAFDFWIGNWEVKQADGTPAGVNRIIKAQGGCVLQEHWESARQGFTGTSFTYYNQRSTQWEQLWVDNGGNILKLKGERQGDQMILSSEPFTGPEGHERVNRITWTLLEDGKVRQLWEVLQGETAVQVLFDGYYQRVAE